MNARIEWVQKRSVNWLGTLGALPLSEQAQAKALLASWNATDGNQCISNYGLDFNDANPATWGNRDGWALACFVNWWNKNSKSPALPPAGTKNGVAWVDLTGLHLTALQKWGVETGNINPGQIPGFPGQTPSPVPVPTPIPAPMDLATCLLQCAQQNALDPVAAASCVAACNAKFPTAPPTLPPPPEPTQPPLPPPPAPIPGETGSSSSPNTPLLVVGALAALGIGALLVSGARSSPPAALQENWAVSASVSGRGGKRRRRRRR